MASGYSDYLPFAGLPTFWRTEHTRDLDGVDIAVMGVPFDCGTSNRPGARFGAQEIRRLSLHTGNFHHPWPTDVTDTKRVIDYGDVGMSVGPDAIATMIGQSQEHADRVFAAGARLFTLGGDHTVPYGPVRAARRHHGPLALVHFDSHQDSLSGNGGRDIFHGTFAHDLAAEGSVDASRSTQAFIRTDMPNENGYDILYAHEAFYLDPRRVAERITANAGDAPVYITFDIDCLDPAYAPGTGTPVPGGPSTGYVREVLRHMRGLNVVGGDMAEVAPHLDPSEITAMAAGTIIGDILQLMAAADAP
ncbi:agmatinase [Nocardiopsis trehalosi]|jgi:agmatinase|uniref:agmatinase n=1 Tax=Nocardiopsis trehalosi TaxID=109329 RepID=UPI0008335DBC|nr:agmatinase [Nocardiopsis trehalosi]